MHHVDGGRNIRTRISDRLDLLCNEVSCLLADKAFPIQIQAMQKSLSQRRWTLYLVKRLVGMTPEGRAPCLIERIHGLILFLYPVAKSLLTERTMALAAILIGDMPEDDLLSLAITLCQFCIDSTHFLAIDRRSIAMVVAVAIERTLTSFIDAEYLQVFLGHPLGSGAGWCRQND